MMTPAGRFTVNPWALIVVLAFCVVGPVSADESDSDAGSWFPLTLADRFGRDLSEHGITLVDWEGYIANPAIPLSLSHKTGRNLPARIRLSANGARLMFDLYSEAAEEGPTKTMFITEPDQTLDFLMSIFPDRDGKDEDYELTVDFADGAGYRFTETIPVRVIDQDRPDRPNEFEITLDFSHDKTGFFDDPRHRAIARQAAADWAYFIADMNLDKVGVGEETSWMWEPDGFKEGNEITNSAPFRGFLLYMHGIQHEERRSGGAAADREGSGFQSVGGKPIGLRRSGTVSIEVTGNWNGLGWLISEDDSGWHKSSNNMVEQHDFYSVVRHEMSHTLCFHAPHTGYAESVRNGRFCDETLRGYLGEDPVVNNTEHFIETVDPRSRVGGFGNEYGGDMPKKRWLATKFELLAVQACGYTLRDTTPLRPLSLTGPTEVELTVNSSATVQFEAGGGIPAYFFSIESGTLPAGLSLDSFTGEIAGVATETGTFPLVVEVRDNDPGSPTARASVTLLCRAGDRD